MINIVSDIPEDYELIQVDTDIKETLDYIGYNGTEEFTVLFVKIDNADYSKVYGCYCVPWLNASVVELK